ncbi:hypothetical protein DRJ17_05970 [Candidatus Woesearchaeota archaeon]|nr:MAG: hypothetical protein DRJ17_05970 [Candidatus Woesearchaeota archaeon]
MSITYNIKLKTLKKALSFDGEDDYVVIDDSPSLQISDTITVEAVARIRTLVSSVVIGKYTITTSTYNLFYASDSKDWVFRIRGDDMIHYYARSGVKPVVNRWYHLVGVYDGGKMYLYIDGELKATVNVGVGLDLAVGGYISVGARYRDSGDIDAYFDGDVAFVRIYNCALSESEVKRLYRGDFISDGLVLYFDFSEGVGLTVYDKSGNENDGTIYGASWVEAEVDFSERVKRWRLRDEVNSISSLMFEAINYDESLGLWLREGNDVVIDVNDVRFWRGIINRVSRKYDGYGCVLSVEALDYLSKLRDYVLYKRYARRYADEIVKDMIKLSGINLNTYHVKPTRYIPYFDANGETIYKALRKLAENINARLYVDGYLNLHFTPQKQYALKFDGVDDYVEVPHSDSLNLNVLTVMVWFKSTYSGEWFRTIVAKYGYEMIQESWGLGWVAPNRLGFYIRDASGTKNDAGAGDGEGLDGKWHFLVGVASDTKVQFWMDGVLKKEVMRTVGDIRNTRPITLGMHYGFQFVPEDIGEVLIYNRALSESEILWNYLHPFYVVRDGLVLELLFNEGDGSTAYDSSGYDNHGTIYGASWVEL